MESVIFYVCDLFLNELYCQVEIFHTSINIQMLPTNKSKNKPNKLVYHWFSPIIVTKYNIFTSIRNHIAPKFYL